MRIDIGAHVGNWPFRRYPDENVGGLLSRMDDSGIDLAFVSNLNAIFYANSQNGNEELASWIAANRAARGRLIGQAVINPAFPGWRRDLQECRDKFGFRGIRLYPEYHDYDFSHPALAEVLGIARDAGLPVTFTLRMIDSRGRSWLDTQKIKQESEHLLLVDVAGLLGRFSGLRAVVLQTHYMEMTPEGELALKAADVLFDMTRASGCGVVGSNSYDLLAAFAKYGEGKFAYGSMSPFIDVVSPLLRIDTADISDTTRAALWSGNARRFFTL